MSDRPINAPARLQLPRCIHPDNCCILELILFFWNKSGSLSWPVSPGKRERTPTGYSGTNTIRLKPRGSTRIMIRPPTVLSIFPMVFRLDLPYATKKPRHLDIAELMKHVQDDHYTLAYALVHHFLEHLSAIFPGQPAPSNLMI